MKKRILKKKTDQDPKRLTIAFLDFSRHLLKLVVQEQSSRIRQRNSSKRSLFQKAPKKSLESPTTVMACLMKTLKTKIKRSLTLMEKNLKSLTRKSRQNRRRNGMKGR